MRAKTKTFLLLFNAIVLLQAESTLEKAVEYRKAEQFSQAERLLKKYSVPADFAGLSSSEKPEFLRGVLELAHVSGNLVPLINGGGGFIPTSPPTANQWADGTAITGWTIQNTPQPGFIWARHNPNPGGSGYCGIVDYDGRVISAGEHNVNRRQKLDGATVRRYNQ